MISRMSVPALTAIVIALGLLLSGCQGGPAVGAEEPKSKASAPPPREVRVTPAAERTVARTVSATGTLAADEQVVLGTKVAGRLAEITVDLGTRVRGVRRSASSIRATSSFGWTRLTPRSSRRESGSGSRRPVSDERVDPEKTAIVRQARAMLDDARLTRDRSVKLMEMELIARAQLDSVEASLQVAEARYQDALEEVRNRQAVIAQRRSELDLARQQLADTVILSPLDGAVSLKQASVGEYLTAGTLIATLVRVHPLAPARPRSRARGRRCAGRTRGDADRGRRSDCLSGSRGSPLAGRAGAERTLLVEAEVPNDRGFLRPGSFARSRS